MTAQKGRDLLLKIEDAVTSDFVTVAGLRSHTLSFNSETVDITHQDSAGAWRELLAGAGLKTANIRGSGIFRDAAADSQIRSDFFGDVIRAWQVIIPGFGTVEGPFQITALEYGGEHDRELTFDLALESAGELTFAVV